jgi:transposase-like protein
MAARESGGGHRVPKTLPEFQQHFSDEDACIAYLYAKRFPDGFVCQYCGQHEEQAGPPYTFTARPSVFRCRNCKRDTSLTAGTIMHRSKQPLYTWFWAAFLVTGLTPGMSAVQLKKMLGIRRYETAFQMLHRLRAAMVRPERGPIGQKFPVEVDETLVGGATQGKGRGVTDKVLVVGAVEVMPRRESEKWGGRDPNLMDGRPPMHRGGHGRGILAGRLRLQVVPNRKQETLVPFVKGNVASGAQVRTDAWIGYEPLTACGYAHEAVAVRGDHAKTDKHLPMIHIAFGNLDAWLLGTHHGVSPQHLPAYLNEYVFRFNRRFWPMAAFDSVLGIAVRTAAPTYEELYEGAWMHPGAWHV